MNQIVHAMTLAAILFGAVATTSLRAGAMQIAAGGESNAFAAAASDANVNFSTGGATISVPIVIPQGRMLTTPSLTLTYSHLGGLSSAGMGWSLPLGVISRQTKYGIPRCDGLVMNEFEMVLSGSSNELVQASTQDPNRYVQKVDEAWSEAIANRSQNSWTVHTRAGLTYTFGATPEARVVSGPNDTFHDTSSNCTSFTSAWYVTKVTDTNGNLLVIEYEKYGNTPIPKFIYYGGTENDAGTSLIKQHPYQIEIVATPIDGKPLMRSFSSGAEQILDRRITEIVVRYREDPQAPFVNEVRRYTLAYDDGSPTQEFFLSSVAATDLPTRTFRYATSTASVVDGESGELPDPETLQMIRGRGPSMLFMDLNADGLLDRIKGDDNSGTWSASYGTSNSPLQFDSTPTSAWALPAGYNGNNIVRDTDGNGQSSDEYTTIDMNGDAIPDFVARESSPARVRVYKGACQSFYLCGFFGPLEYWNNPGTSNNQELRHTIVHDSDHQARSTTRELIDMNGDGRPDIVRSDPSGNWNIYLNTGAGFEATPVVYSNIDNDITYTRRAEFNGQSEVALIDVNSDGLPDRVSMPEILPGYSSNPDQVEKFPRDYFIVDLGGSSGPYSVGSSGPLCMYGVVNPCPGASIPTTSAVVPAVSVQLNTGHGFTAPIYSPAPFYKPFSDRTGRLRAMRVDNGGADTRTVRDFLDVNGDGRVDWVVTGDEYTGATPDTDWYVMLNLGDGRFGGGLTVLAGRTMLGSNLTFLGEVRPATTLVNINPFLSQSHALTNPGDQVNTQMAVLDIDGDGIAEWVSSKNLQGALKWDLKKLRFEKDRQNNPIPHTKPMLLVGMADGVGGVTEFQYSPSSKFAALTSGGSTSGGMPFTQWVVTGIRRTDGLCSSTPADWFTTAGNPCLASGNELVQSISYRDAKYDGTTREFRGFRQVTISDAPMVQIAGALRPLGGSRRLTYFQDANTKGKIDSEVLLVGDQYELSVKTYKWLSVTDGPRTQIYVGEQKIFEHANVIGSAPNLYTPASQCVIHRNSIHNGTNPDPWNRVHTSCSMPCSANADAVSTCAPAVEDKKQLSMTYVNPAGSFTVYDRPATMVSTYVNSALISLRTAETQFYYDNVTDANGQPILGQATRGRLTLKKTKLLDNAPNDESWAYEYTTYDSSGNIKSVRVPRSLSDNRGNHEFTYDDQQFSMFPLSENLPSTVANGATVQHTISRIFDVKTGKVITQTGIAGDVSGAIYDSLGRPVCRYEPGTSCAGSGFVGVAQYEYHFGVPSAGTIADRLNWVRVKRREPNAPSGYLVTTTYSDALGRERFTTNQQLNSATNSIQTVMVRQIAYGTNGKPAVIYEPYWISGLDGLPTSLNAPGGTAYESTSYVLNGNASGYLDPAGRVFSVNQFNGGTPKSFYVGNVVTSQSADGRRTTASKLDAHGRVIQRISVGSGTTPYSEQMDAVYDGADRVLFQWFGGSLATVVSNAYDLAGRLLSTADPDSGTWTRKYDLAGNVIFDNDPVTGQSVQSCYDEQDRVLLQCGRNTDTYDPGFCAIASPSCTRAFTYKYDETALGKGRLTTAINTNTKIQYVYDIRGRVTSRQDTYIGSTKTTSFQYQSDIDRMTRMTYPDGEIVKYGYDAAGQPSTLSRVSSSDQWLEYYVAAAKYDIHGKPTYIQRGNYTTDTMSYHGAAENFRLASARSERVSSGPTDPGEVFLNLSYDDYDANGRLIAMTDGKFGSGPLSMSGTYTYDAGGRLTAAAITGQGSESFSYDAIGNMIAKTGATFGFAQPTKPHQATSLGATASTSWEMTYNDNGQRITKIGATSNQSYVYDAFGNLIQLTVNGTTTYYGYDHTGAKVFETPTNGGRWFYGKYSEGLASSQLLVKYYYFGDQAVATKADSAPWLFGAGSAPIAPLSIPPEIYWSVMSAALVLLFLPLSSRRRRWSNGAAPSAAAGATLVLLSVGLPLGFSAGCMGDAPTRHLHLGHLGGPLAVSKVGGDVDRQYRYSAYGEVRRYDKNGVTVAFDDENRREYTGYETDSASGLQYAGLRFYDPTVASFTSHDPANQVANPYAYVGWDPINRIDPSGGLAGEVIAAIVIAVLAITLAIAQAIYSAVLSGSAGTFFGSLALSLSGVGTIMGVVRQPSTIGFSIPIVGGIAAGIYGVATAQSPADAVFAGVGLGIAVASAALAAYSMGAKGQVTLSDGKSVPKGSDAARAALKQELDAMEADGRLNVNDVFGSESMANRAVLEQVAPLSRRYGFEVSGNVMETPMPGDPLSSGYSYTMPEIGGTGGATVSGAWTGYHTHPSGSIKFSNFAHNSTGGLSLNNDVSWVKQNHQRLYVGAYRNSRVRIGMCDITCNGNRYSPTSPARTLK